MPELPEVEGARRLAERNCVGKPIVEAIVADDDKVIQGMSHLDMEGALRGRRVVAAKRVGKHLWLQLDTGPALMLHFGMTGGLVVKGVGAAHYKNFTMDETNWPPRFCKIELALGDGTRMAFCDSRRFARARMQEDPLSHPPLCDLGWDPLLSWPDVADFGAKLTQQRRAIKAVLLDQAFSAGVGNWVADEVLYQARVHPEQPAASLSQEQVGSLHHLVQEVCQVASDVEAVAEKLPKSWLFHYRWGKGSKEVATVGGHAIAHITVGGRTSAYVPKLQKLDKAAAAAAVAGPPKAAKRASKGDQVAGAAGGGGRRKKGGAKAGSGGGAEGSMEGEAGATAVAAAGPLAAAAVAGALDAAAEVVEGSQGREAPRGAAGKRGGRGGGRRGAAGKKGSKAEEPAAAAAAAPVPEQPVNGEQASGRGKRAGAAGGGRRGRKSGGQAGRAAAAKRARATPAAADDNAAARVVAVGAGADGGSGGGFRKRRRGAAK